MILLMGIAGSGKGTQSKLLAEKDGFHVISTGELLRQFGSASQHERMKKGDMLGDEEVTLLLEQALIQTIDQNHVILDGYPRRISQAKWLYRHQQDGRFKIDGVIHLIASKEAVKARLLERGRQDDHGEGIDQRFKEYEHDTLPILEYFEEAGIKVKTINAERPIETVHQEIADWLNKHVN